MATVTCTKCSEAHPAWQCPYPADKAARLKAINAAARSAAAVNPPPRFNLAAQVKKLGPESLLPPEKPKRAQTKRRSKRLIAPKGECDYCDRRREYNTALQRRRRRPVIAQPS